MKKFLILTIFFIGCNNPSETNTAFKEVNELDYTYDSGWKNAFSIKINRDGTCVVGEGRWSIKYYTGMLTGADVQAIDSFVKSIPFREYDSAYHEDKVDQLSYKVVFINNNNDTISKFVYGEAAPQPLNDFSNRLRSIKENLQLTARDTIVDFLSRKNFYPKPIED